MELPTGRVTFLFTDIEGSTKLWEQRPDAMRLALARHDALLRHALESHNGSVFKTVGDSFYAVFAHASDALAAALAAQLELKRAENAGAGPEMANMSTDIAVQPLPADANEAGVTIRVRMALHVGVAEHRNNDYFGPPLNRVARLLAIGHGGQTLLSDAVREQVQATLPEAVSLQDMGLHRLKDLERAEHVWQLAHPDLPTDFPRLKSLPMQTNLPVPTTTFIGRQKEIQDIQTLFAQTRLLTLTGPGGTGKTRLALQVAAELAGEDTDGVWFIEFAPLSDPDLVPQTVATTLGIREEPGKPLLQALTEGLKSQNVLLLLDNCEHVLAPTARLADALLRACPRLRILATSREGLNLSGETLYRVPTLGLPDPDAPPSVERLAEVESVSLFASRAQAVQPGFSLTRQNAPTIASVCHRLDGIPLALELAAARVRALSVEQIAARLDDRFRLLTGGSRAALPRQQTLRALIDWSYELLNAQERLLLHRLSVFAGGWTLEAAEAVCTDAGIEDWEILDLLSSLADKSLVLFEEQASLGRYRLLETVRQYSRERLQESGEEHTARGRHCDYFLALAEQAEPQLIGPEQGAWLDRLERELDNFRTAFDWCAFAEDFKETGLRLAGAFNRFWYMRGYLSEGSTLLERVLTQAENLPPTAFLHEHARALNAAGTLRATRGDLTMARDFYTRSLELRRQLGDRSQIAGSLNNLAYIAHEQGDYDSAQVFLEESRDIYRALGEAWGLATVLNNLGRIPADRGGYEAARCLYEESLALRRTLNDKHGIAMSLNNLGLVAMGQNDLNRAADLYEESLAIRRELVDRPGIGLSLNNLGLVALKRGEHARAAALLREAATVLRDVGNRQSLLETLEGFARLAEMQGAAERAVLLYGALETLREEIGTPVPSGVRAQYAQEVEKACAQLDPETRKTAWNTGKVLTMEQAVAFALEERTDV